MKTHRIWFSLIGVIIAVIASAIYAKSLNPDNTKDLMVAITSLAVALIALLVSLWTFFAIDEVNAISRMEGNVMENSRCQPNIIRSIFRFPEKDFDEAGNALMEHLEGLFRTRPKSGAQLADHVQEVADLLVLIPFFIRTGNREASAVQMDRVSALVEKMDRQVRDFTRISDGSCKLLEETVSLVKAVFAYQKMTASGESDPSMLLQLRGSIFINPVSCLLYRNYLGLYFLHRATSLLNGYRKGLSEREEWESIHAAPSEDRALALVYLDKAANAFSQALNYIGEDSLWRSFVCFNRGRVAYLQERLLRFHEKGATTDWEGFFNESIQCWMTTNRMIAEHFSPGESKEPVTWLQQALKSQENKVILTKALYQMLEGLPLTDQNGHLWVKSYADLPETGFFRSLPETDPQGRSDSLIKEIKALL